MDHTIVHFEIPADDTERARKFYSDVFGWEINRLPGESEYYGVRTTESDPSGLPKGMGVNGGIYPRRNACETPVNYIYVEDIDAYTDKLVEAGGEVAIPKTVIPGHGWMLHFRDPEKNRFALFQPDRTAV